MTMLSKASTISRKERIVEGIAAKLRRQMDRRQFRCLASLLHTIGRELIADEVGVVAFDFKKNATTVIRQIPVCGNTSVSQIPEEVLTMSILASQRAHVESPGFADQCQAMYFRPDELDKWGANDGLAGVGRSGLWLVFVPVWPSEHWKSSSDERHWIYVLRPSLLLSTAADDGNSQLCWALLRFGIEWFTWKHDRLETRYRELETVKSFDNAAQHDDERPCGAIAATDRFVTAVCKTIIRPVRPEHLAKVFGGLVEEDRGNPSAIKRGILLRSRMELISAAASKCSSNPPSNVTAFPFRCVGADVIGVCPQIPELNKANRGILQLFLWRSGFWRAVPNEFRVEEEREQFDLLIQESLNGLRWATVSLDTITRFDVSGKESEFVSVKRGRDRTLLRIFLARAISEGLSLVDDLLQRRRPLPIGKLRWLSQAAHLAVVVITDQPWEADAIRSLIRVIAGYGHEVLCIPSTLDLARHLRQTLRGESALHTLKQRYRDHFFHTIEVCLIGFVLLRSRPEGVNGPEFCDVLLEKCCASDVGSGCAPRFVPIDRQDFYAQWWVAALMHDTAYGIDVLKGTVELLEYFRNNPAIDKFKKDVLSAIATLHSELAHVAPELEHDASILEGDHGVITASHLRSTLEKYGLKSTLRFQPAIRAIAFHNTKSPAVDADRDPIAALLILCDTVQDWGRSQLGYDRSPTVVLSRLVSPAPTPKDEQFGPVQRFSFSLVPQPSAGLSSLCEHVWERPSDLDITLRYSPRAARSSSVYFAWADTTHNLRRVDFQQWGVKLRITHSLPMGERHNSQMSEFARKVQELEAGFLAEWVAIACSGDPHGAVFHEIREGEEKLEPLRQARSRRFECIMFNLLELGRTFKNGERLMGITLKPFAEFCKQAFSKRDDPDADPPQRPPY